MPLPSDSPATAAALRSMSSTTLESLAESPPTAAPRSMSSTTLASLAESPPAECISLPGRADAWPAKPVNADYAASHAFCRQL